MLSSRSVGRAFTAGERVYGARWATSKKGATPQVIYRGVPLSESPAEKGGPVDSTRVREYKRLRQQFYRELEERKPKYREESEAFKRHQGIELGEKALKQKARFEISEEKKQKRKEEKLANYREHMRRNEEEHVATQERKKKSRAFAERCRQEDQLAKLENVKIMSRHCGKWLTTEEKLDARSVTVQQAAR